MAFALLIRSTRKYNTLPHQEKHMIKRILPIGALALAFAGSAWAQDAASLLNKANQINYEEIETAKLAHEKAGDNQALLTYADTIKGDHEANEESVSALSRQKSVKLCAHSKERESNSKAIPIWISTFSRLSQCCRRI
jgi:predicted outer membrane protein